MLKLIFKYYLNEYYEVIRALHYENDKVINQKRV